MADSYMVNGSYVAVGEYGLLSLYDSYWKEQARREIKDAINEVKGEEKLSSLDSWVRKMLYEQKKMRCAWYREKKKKYGRSWRGV